MEDGEEKGKDCLKDPPCRQNIKPIFQQRGVQWDRRENLGHHLRGAYGQCLKCVNSKIGARNEASRWIWNRLMRAEKNYNCLASLREFALV